MDLEKEMKTSVTSDAMAALKDYMQLREALAHTEDCEQDCSCDSDNFHTCEFCKERDTKDSECRCLLNLWADTWAIMLDLATAKLAEFGHRWAGNKYVFDGQDR